MSTTNPSFHRFRSEARVARWTGIAFVLPGLLVVGIPKDPLGHLAVAMCLLIGGFLLWRSLRLGAVELDESNLTVQGFRRRRIPTDQICRFETSWSNVGVSKRAELAVRLRDGDLISFQVTHAASASSEVTDVAARFNAFLGVARDM